MKRIFLLFILPIFLVMLVFLGLNWQFSQKPFSLQILHGADHESSFIDPSTLEPKILHTSKVIQGLKKLAASENMGTIYLTSGDHTLPGPFYEASKEVEGWGQSGIADILFFNQMGLTANGVGNHELDGGIDEFAHMLAKANYPFLSVNLDFSNVKLKVSTPEIKIAEDACHVRKCAGHIARSAYVEVNGEKIGLIGRAPADFFNTANNPDEMLKGLSFYGGRDKQTNQPIISAVGQVLEQVKKLEAKGVNKIILMDHAQDYSEDPLEVKKLRGIDVIISAGWTGFLAKATSDGPFNTMREGDKPVDHYPLMLKDSEGNPVLFVNTDQQYRYVGNLMVTFDSDGLLIFSDERSGPVATTKSSIAALEEVIGEKIIIDPNVQNTYALLQDSKKIKNSLKVLGKTTQLLNGLRADVRARETNLARIMADALLWKGAEKHAIDFALINGGGIRDQIEPPYITELSLSSAFAFNNRFVVIQLTIPELLAALENAVSRYPDRDGRFPHLAGLRITFSDTRKGVGDTLSLSSGERIQSIIQLLPNGDEVTLVKNREVIVDRDKVYKLATNSFLATGGDGYKAFEAVYKERGHVVFDMKEQDLFKAYLNDVLKGKIDLKDPPHFPRVMLSNQ